MGAYPNPNGSGLRPKVVSHYLLKKIVEASIFDEGQIRK